MTTHYFGSYWDVPALQGAHQVPTPVGVPCLYCEHPIAGGDRGYIRPLGDVDGWRLGPVHRGCDFAMVAGHFYGVCSCTGFDDIYERNLELERRGIWKVADSIPAAKWN